MARQLKETANAAQAVAMPEGSRGTVPTEDAIVFDNRPSYMKRDWKPYTTAAELPPAEFVKETREFKAADGSLRTEDRITLKRIGESRYKITPSGELIKVYRKHGGTGTKLIHKFKVYLSDTADAKARNRFNREFRQYLRSKRIPGA